MMRGSPGQSAPRVVVRRKVRGEVANRPPAGSWKIAYADYMTAMMAFFLVMWLLSLIPREELSEVAEYFRMPLMEAVRGGGPTADSTESIIPAGSGIGDSSSIIPGGTPALIPHPEPARGDTFSVDAGGRDARNLRELKSDLDNLIETDPVLEEYRPQLLLDMTPDGLQVQIVDKQSRPMFALGSARMQRDLTIVLRALAPMFNRLPNRITLAGHTDSIQYSTGEREYSNWELSADRANAARRELVAGGLDEDKVKQVLGLSSTVSLMKDEPNAPVNRRISIVVLNEAAERRIDEQAHAGASSSQLEALRASQDEEAFSIEPPAVMDQAPVPPTDDVQSDTDLFHDLPLDHGVDEADFSAPSNPE